MSFVRSNVLYLIRRAWHSTATTVQTHLKPITGPFTLKDHHVCGCFISIYHDTLELSPPTYSHSIQNVVLQKRNKSKMQQHMVTMNARWSITSPRACRHLTRDDVTTIEVQTVGTHVSDAKQKARIQLANRLYTLLKRPDDFMPGRTRKRQIDFVIPIKIDLLSVTILVNN